MEDWVASSQHGRTSFSTQVSEAFQSVSQSVSQSVNQVVSQHSIRQSISQVVSQSITRQSFSQCEFYQSANLLRLSDIHFSQPARRSWTASSVCKVPLDLSYPIRFTR